ncbi:MAG TPA: hypothetical protein VJ729_17430 [Nitrososphaeraceae archaeon]|nr:hypothetical protein [Nitrososphaeraceae archaeon]
MMVGDMTLKLAINSRGTPVICVVLSLLLLLIGSLTYSQIFLPRVIAEPPDPCFGDSCSRSICHNHPQTLSATCCWGVNAGNCQDCNVNTQTGEFENCTPVYRPHIPVNSGKILGGGTLASPNAAPQMTCPDGSAPDANGNCPTSTTNQLQSQPLSNNNPTSTHHHKGSSTDLGQTGGRGGGQESSLTTRKGSSPTPPACPTTGSEPIPPDCTKKPKF